MRHEGHQLWESSSKGLLTSQNDFVIINNKGIKVAAMSDKFKKRLKALTTMKKVKEAVRSGA